MPAEDYDDERHKREEAERRAKRKASKSSRSEAQREKDRKGKEYRQKILQKHGAAPGGNDAKRQKTGSSSGEKAQVTSAFQELFAQRAQGFQIEFRFRNAPPRPPVGPCFVGNSLDAVLAEESRQYKPFNAVELNHTWKLHSEPDIGVPLAPSAMNLKSYEKPDENAVVPLHPDDEALLDWKGSMGDTAADHLKRRREQARAAARMAASGRGPPPKPTQTAQTTKAQQKKAFSRVLKEDMQTWMKKTTYLSNDYSRKVHDFKSLAQTKSELAIDLQSKQEEMKVRRSAKAIKELFDNMKPLQHPTKKQLKPVSVMQVLPDTINWGRAFTHLVIDKAPNTLPEGYNIKSLNNAFVTNVEKKEANARMTCDIIVPSIDQEKEKDLYNPIQSYDLDVIPLKEEDIPHMNFCIWINKNKKIATYIPVASRVQLATGRPAVNKAGNPIERRALTDEEIIEIEERAAEIDQDLAEKHHIERNTSNTFISSKAAAANNNSSNDSDNNNNNNKQDDDDGEDDFGDSDSEEEEVFGGGTETIVAES